MNLDRLLELAGAICDETASQNDRVELKSMVLADPTARRCYLNYGPVRIFVSAVQGTLFAGESRQPVLEHDGEMVQRLFPVPNRHRPPLRRLANRHVNQL